MTSTEIDTMRDRLGRRFAWGFQLPEGQTVELARDCPRCIGALADKVPDDTLAAMAREDCPRCSGEGAILTVDGARLFAFLQAAPRMAR